MKYLFYFHRHHGDIIVEFFGLDELAQAMVDPFDDLLGGKWALSFRADSSRDNSNRWFFEFMASVIPSE